MSKLLSLLRDVTRVKSIDTDYLHHSELPKNVGLFDLIGIALSSSVTLGAFVLVPLACRNLAGPSTTTALLILLIVMLITGQHYCEIALRFPKSAPTYVACYAVFGELFAFFFAWLSICDYTIAVAYVGREWSNHVRYLFNNSLRASINNTQPVMDEPAVDYTAMVGLAVITLMFLCSMRVLGVLTLVLSVVSTLIISSSILVGFFYSHSSMWVDHGFAPFGGHGVLKAAGAVSYAFVTMEVMSSLSEEVNSPGRSYPVMMPTSIIVSFFYLFFLSAVSTLTLPYTNLSTHVALPILYGAISVPASRYVLSVGSVCGLAATLLILQVPGPRILYSLAGDGLMFRVLGYNMKRSGTPIIGAVVLNFISGLLTLIPTQWYCELLRVTFPLRCLICLSVCVLMRYSDCPGISDATANGVFYNHLRKRKDKVYTYSYVDSNGSIVSATLPLPDDSNFSLSDSVSSDYIAQNIAAIRINRSSTFSGSNKSPPGDEVPKQKETSNLLRERSKTGAQCQRSYSTASANSSASAAKISRDKGHGSSEPNHPTTTGKRSNVEDADDSTVGETFLHANGGHDCTTSPCTPHSEDHRGHLYDREIPDVPFYHAFDAQHPQNTAGSESYISLPGNLARTVRVSFGACLLSDMLVVVFALYATESLMNAEWWAVCVQSALVIFVISTNVYFCRLPKVQVSISKKAAGVPYLSMVAILILMAIIFAAEPANIVVSFALFLPGNWFALTFSLAHFLSRDTRCFDTHARIPLILYMTKI